MSKRRSASEYEDELYGNMALLSRTEQGFPMPERQLMFAPPRRWRFDFAWPALKFAAEVEGGHHRMVMRSARDGRPIVVVGHHQHDKGYQSDLEKYNRAAELGWMVLRFSQRQVTSGEAMNQIERAIKACQREGGVQ